MRASACYDVYVAYVPESLDLLREVWLGRGNIPPIQPCFVQRPEEFVYRQVRDLPGSPLCEIRGFVVLRIFGVNYLAACRYGVG